ncbi:MAG: hypothetical protein IVW52_20790 [Acidimicrobiales bacterium]|nr:hypothetical protein [Acidimicrobiales bacterium]
MTAVDDAVSVMLGAIGNRKVKDRVAVTVSELPAAVLEDAQTEAQTTLTEKVARPLAAQPASRRVKPGRSRIGGEAISASASRR